MSSRPFLAVTMGDPAGVGPEIIVKALGETRLYEICIPVVVGDTLVMEQAVSQIVGASTSINIVEAPKEAQGVPGTLDIYPLHGLDLSGFSPGKLDPKCGHHRHHRARRPVSRPRMLYLQQGQSPQRYAGGAGDGPDFQEPEALL